MCVRLYVCLCAFSLLVNGTIAQHHDSMSTDDFGYNPDGQDAVSIADALGGILQLPAPQTCQRCFVLGFV